MKISLKLLALISVLLASSAYAAEEFIALQDNKAILGLWHVHHETPALNKGKVKINNEWSFGKNGIISAISRDRRIYSNSGQVVKVKYSVVDGVIRKQLAPGREKYEDCKVIEMQGKDMTLHCKFNYFFMTKK